MQKRLKVNMLGMAAAAFVTATPALAQVAYPYNPYPSAPSRTYLAESHLQASGCAPTGDRDFQRGIIYYGCRAGTPIRTDIPPSGPSCTYQGTAVRNRGWTQEDRYACFENRYDYQQDYNYNNPYNVTPQRPRYMPWDNNSRRDNDGRRGRDGDGRRDYDGRGRDGDGRRGYDGRGNPDGNRPYNRGFNP